LGCCVALKAVTLKQKKIKAEVRDYVL